MRHHHCACAPEPSLSMIHCDHAPVLANQAYLRDDVPVLWVHDTKPFSLEELRHEGQGTVKVGERRHKTSKAQKRPVVRITLLNPPLGSRGIHDRPAGTAADTTTKAGVKRQHGSRPPDNDQRGHGGEAHRRPSPCSKPVLRESLIFLH